MLLALYASDGPSIRLTTADRFGLVGEVVDTDVVAISYRAAFLAIGWRRRTGSGVESVLNPRSDQIVELGRDDQIVVIGAAVV